jgi:eukaryotic-like serine/threonine-protein kinase
MHGSGIGHLDLKPSNVVLRASGEPTIVDFGLAGRHLRPGCGTVAYAAPEIWGVVPEGAVPSPLAADMYGFGCVAFELFTGRTLFDGNDEIALVSAHVAHDGRPEGIARLAELPRLGHLAATLSHCLRRDPRDRPSVAAVRGALRNVSASIAQLPWPLVHPMGGPSVPT